MPWPPEPKVLGQILKNPPNEMMTEHEVALQPFGELLPKLHPAPPGAGLSSSLSAFASHGVATFLGCPNSASGFTSIVLGGPSGIPTAGPHGVWYPWEKNTKLSTAEQKALLAALTTNAISHLRLVDPSLADCVLILRTADVEVSWIPDLPPVQPPVPFAPIDIIRDRVTALHSATLHELETAPLSVAKLFRDRRRTRLAETTEFLAREAEALEVMDGQSAGLLRDAIAMIELHERVAEDAPTVKASAVPDLPELGYLVAEGEFKFERCC